MQRSLAFAGMALAGALVLLMNAFFIVPVDQQAIVLQFGAQQDVINEGPDDKEAGLRLKIPFVQNVLFYDKKNQGFDLPEQEIIAADQQRLKVDAMARYRIKDPLQFFRRATTPANGEIQLAQRMVAALREELGKVETSDIISGKRAQVMKLIRDSLNQKMASFGVEIIDVRIRRADLPEANSERVFQRMITEAQQKAAQFRAEGDEQATKIRAEADKQAQVLLAEANEQAQKIRGEGDAKRNAIYAAAYGKDPEFFSFYRSMKAYEESITDGTPFVLTPDSEFFKYFKDSRGR